MGKVFFYGSLKKGFYNFDRFNLSENARFIKEATLSGAKMYDLGQYPCISLSNDPADKVKGEIYEYLDNSTEVEIRFMELTSHFREKQMLIDGHFVSVFIFVGEIPDYFKRVESGEWIKGKKVD